MDANRQRYPGWAGVCSFDPATEEIEVHVVADILPDEIAAVLALTPHVDEDADWATREQAAAVVDALAAASAVDSWGWCFAEKQINYEPDGDVLWA